MENKQFDDFSFKAPSSEPSQSSIPENDNECPTVKPSIINYRHIKEQPPINIFYQPIHQKITMISHQLQHNVRRRVQLEKQLQSVREVEQRHQKRDIFMEYSQNRLKNTHQVAAELLHKSDNAKKIIGLEREISAEEVRVRKIEQSKDVLLRDGISCIAYGQQKIVVPILNSLAALNPKPLPVYTIPDQVKIQGLLRKVTFPEIPSGSLEVLQKQIEKLYALHQPHSDIHFLLMVICYHRQRYLKVRQHFDEIINFKVFNAKAYWISAEAEFASQNYELCLKLSQDCMRKLDRKYLPRFVYLKAKCYSQTANYINSLVCYNQLIKIRPKISEYYLERGILQHRIGYYHQAKEDFALFALLHPSAETVIKQKIIVEKNETKKQEYIAILAKMF